MDKLHGDHVFDLSSLDSLRQQAQADPDASLRQVAEQFEGIFMNLVLKSMREANAAFEDEDSPFHSQTTGFYRQMHDSQLASELSSAGSLGLADLIVAQLGGNDALSPSLAPAPVGVVLPPSAPSAPATTEATPATVQPPLQSAQNPAPPVNFDSPEHFVRAMLPQARETAAKLGQDPLLLIAQSALETGWGQKVLSRGEGQSSHNLFNIKADNRWEGPRVHIRALEFEQDVPVMTRSAFRAYQDYAASFEDYFEFLQQPRYQEAHRASDGEGFMRALQRAGYATDPNYADKVLGLFKALKADFGAL